MVYSNKFIICILFKGKPQKELANGVVELPFGSEYAIRLRNKNSRRAVAVIFVDGENVSGGGYVIKGNDYVDIERHHDKDKAFKFVSLDSGEAADFGKNGPNEDKTKGTIEVKFYLEKELPVPQMPWVYKKKGPFQPPQPYYMCPLPEEEDLFAYCTHDTSNNVLRSSSSKKLDDGCTVEGKSTGQNFTSVHIDTESTFTSIKLFLQGYEKAKKKKKKKTNKDQRLDVLESENEKLRQKIAELENEKLRERLEELEG